MAHWITHLFAALAALLYPTTHFGDGAALAAGIDAAAREHPLPGPDGVAEMARELAVLAATEGHFDAGAIGRDQFGVSLGAYQLHETTLRWLGRSYAEAFDPMASAEIAAGLIVKSHEVCAEREPAHALGWYASGGAGCDVPEGLAASERRMRYAERLRAIPVYWAERRQILTKIARDRG